MQDLRFFALGMAAAVMLAGAGPVAAAEKDLAQIVFSAAERSIITDYYGDGDTGENAERGKGAGKNKGNKGRGNKGQGVGSQGLPPGLAGREVLPPGIAMRQLPGTLASRLPPAPTGFERAIIDNDLVLVEIGTRIVHDIITDIVTK